MLSKKQLLLFVVTGVSIGSIAYALTPRNKTPKQDPVEQREIITTVPQIISCPKKLKVIKAEIKDEQVLVDVENTSDVGVIAVSMTTAKGRSAYTVTLRDSFKHPGDPVSVIKPHEIVALTMEVSNVFPGVPLTIDGVLYADGTEDGCDLKLLHKTRERETKNYKEKTGQ